MKTRVLVAILTMLLGVSLLSAASTSPGWSYGFELGVSKGDNADSSDENFGPLGRGFFQFEHIPQLITRIGLGYTQLKAPGIYSTQTMMGDARFLVRPIQFDKFSPFLYAGIGASKELKDNRADIIPMFPAGVGFQTRLSQRMTLELSGGYYLILSDDLDGVERADNDLNRYTDRKHDGFFSLTAGLFFNEKPQTPVKREPAPSVNLKDMDTDGDGLSDYDEIYVYKTDPKKADTDGDGLNDYVEVMQYKTDPRKADTDGDGLSDYAEVMTHKTDPLKVDTDGDCI
ncbi:MAG: hypothetical protein U1B83_05370 [Candidatus Cloacimonadaceae bacterium]|nr:hypothetical protein [Candidatus Cloacimonadaceae bacterium]